MQEGGRWVGSWKISGNWVMMEVIWGGVGVWWGCDGEEEILVWDSDVVRAKE